MRFLMGMLLGCCAMVGYAQDGAPEEVVKADETTTSEGQEGVPVEAHEDTPNKGGCGCGKPKVF